MKKSFLLCFMLILSATQWVKAQPKIQLYPGLQAYIRNLPDEFSQVTDERKLQLKELARYAADKIKAGESVNLVFICTHNSRRSQMGQAWANVAVEYYGFESGQFNTFSGGTEATAFNERAVAALIRAGFQIKSTDEKAKNPPYEVSYSADKAAFFTYSKKYSDPQNPQSKFAAILVCSQAAEACPVVKGADKRISLPYEDPKNHDRKADETAFYDLTSRLIAREVFYLFKEIRKLVPVAASPEKKYKAKK